MLTASIATAFDTRDASQFLIFQYSPEPDGNSEIGRAIFIGDIGLASTTKRLVFSNVVLTGDVYRVNSGVQTGEPTDGEVITNPELISSTSDQITEEWIDLWRLDSDETLGDVDFSGDLVLDYTGTPDNEIVIDFDFFRHTDGTLTIRADEGDNFIFRIKDGLELGRSDIALEGINAGALIFAVGEPSNTVHGSIEVKMDAGAWFGTLFAPYAKSELVNLSGFQGMVISGEIKLKAADDALLVEQVTPPIFKNNQTITTFTPVDGTTFLTTDTTNILAEATSALPVTLTVIKGPGQLSGTSLSFTGTGLVEVEASQPGDNSWNPAPPRTNTYTVAKVGQIITGFLPPDGTAFRVSDTTNLSAAASSGLPVGFVVVSGPGTISGGNILSFSGPGSVEIAATQIGDDIWEAATPVIHTYTVNEGSQVITGFMPPDGTTFVVSDTTNLTASATSGLPVGFTVVSGPGFISGNNVLNFSGAGTVEVAASQSGDAEWNAAPTITNTYTVSKDDQIITDFVPTNGTTFTTFDSITLSATTSSGLPASFNVVSGPGTVSGGNVLTFAGTGTVSVVASQDGSDEWNPAISKTNAYIVIRSDQNILDFTPVSGSTFTATNTPKLFATATSGLPVSFSVISGPGELAGDMLSFSGTGTVSVAAFQEGNADWNSAPPETNTYTVTSANQVITDFLPADGASFILTDQTNLSATASSGLPVRFSVLSGPASIISDNTLSFSGTGSVVVQAAQDGNDIWGPAAPVAHTYSVGMGDQTITGFTPSNGTAFLTSDAPNLSATASSGLPVIFSVTGGPGSISGDNKLIFSGAGTVQVQADQAGNADWNAAPPVGHVYTVNKADQVISNFTPTNGTEFLVTDTETMEAEASSGLTVGFNIVSGPAFIVGRNDLHFSGPGTVLVETFQPGDDDWNAAIPLTNTYTAIKVPQNILTFTPPDGTAFVVTDVTNLAATTSSDLPVMFTIVSGPGSIDGNNLSFTGTGSVSVEASQPGTDVIAAAPPITNTYTVGQAEQSITGFLPADGSTFQEIETVNLTADASSGLPVTFTVIGGPGSIDSGNTLGFTGTGTVTVEATQPGDADWNAATPVTHTYTITQSDQVITAFLPTTLSSFQTTDTPQLSATASSGLTVVFNVISGPGSIDSGNILSFSGNGTVQVEASQPGDADWNAAIPLTNSYSVGKTTATVIISNTNQTYTGNSIEVDVTTSPTGLPVSVVYELTGVRAASLPVNAGSYGVLAGIDNDPVYQGSATATLTISKADQNITGFTPSTGTSFLTTDTAVLVATADSGLATTFAIISGPGIITDGINLSFSTTGTVAVAAYQSGDDNWNAAPAVTNTYTVTKADQTISGFIPADESTFFVGSRTNLSATASSGLPVSFNVVSGPAVLIGGNLLVFEGVGTVEVEAIQPGNADWNASPPVINTYTTTKVDQNITDFTPTNGTPFRTTDSAVLSATASSGLDVTFTVVSGPGTISGGNNLTFSSTGTVQVAASQAGNPFYNAASKLTNTYTVSINDQTITDFTPAAGTIFLTTDVTNLSATASSGLPVGFTVVSGPGTITDVNQLNFNATGTVFVAATQPGNNDWNPAVPITNTYLVVKADQVISGFTPTNGTAFLTIETTNLSASATSGLDVSFTVLSGPGLITGGDMLSFTSNGTVIVSAAQNGNSNWNAAPSLTNTYSVSKTDQGITGFTPVDGTGFLTIDTTNLAASASSGFDVRFTVVSGSGQITAGNTLSFNGGGTVEVAASQDGDAIWNAAPPVIHAYTVNKTAQIISNFTPTNGSAFLISETAMLEASASSGLVVSFRVISGPGTINGEDRLSFNGTGNVVVEVRQEGDDVWNAAVSLTNTYAVSKVDQTISSFIPVNGTSFVTTNTVVLNATATSGLNVSFAVVSGPGSIAGGNALIFSGPGAVEVSANQAGDSQWNPATSLTNVYNVIKADQTISNFTPTEGSTFLTGDSTNLNATASSGLPVGFKVISGPAVIRGGNILTLTGAGPVKVSAFQDGNNIWNPAPTVTNTYGVIKQDQAISGFTPTGGTAFLTIDSTNLSATASSGLPVSFTVVSGPGIITGGERLSFSASGTVLVEASQPGDGEWNAAPPLTNAYNVSKASASVILSDLNQSYDGSPRPVAATTDPAGLTVNLLYDGTSNAPAGPGNYTVIGTIDDMFYSGTNTEMLVISQGDQVITGFVPPNLSVFETTDTPSLTANASSGLPVSFAVVDGPGVLDGNVLSFTNSGSVSVEATQVGNTNWNAAVPLTNVYSVGKTAATITISNTNQTYTGSIIEVDTTTSPTGLPVSVVYQFFAGQRLASLPVDAGKYAVLAGVVTDPTYQGEAASILTINPADQVITNFLPASGSTYLTTNVVSLTAGAESGLDVEFTVISGPGTIESNTLYFSDSVLPVLVEAAQPGDNNWNAAPPLTNSYMVLNSLPLFTSVPVTNATQGVPYSYIITTDDIDGDTVFVTAPILPNWLTLDRLTLSSSDLNGTPGNASVGIHPVMLVAEDGDGGSTTQSFEIVVGNVNDDPAFTSTPVTFAALNLPYEYVPTAVDIDGDTVTITAPTLADWMVFDGTMLTGIPSVIGTNPVVLVASDGNGGSATQRFDVVADDFLPAPILMSAIDITSSNFLARWKPTDNATGYYVDVSTSTNFTTNITGYDNLYVGDGRSVLVTGLTENTVYYYQARAEYISVSSADSLPSDPVLTSEDSTFPLVDYTNAVVSVGGFDYLLFEDLFKGSDLVVELITNTEPSRVEAVLDSEGILLNYLDLGNAVVEIGATAPNGSRTRLPIELTIVTAPILDDSETVTFNLQNGLFEQTVYVFNTSLLPADTVTLTASNLTTETSLYNATGINIYGYPEIKWVGTLPGGGLNAFVLQFYTTEPIIPSGDVIASLNLVPPDQLIDREVTADFIISPTSGPNRFGEMVIEFSSVPGEVYYVQYKDNMLDEWKLAYPAIMAITSRTQWIDSGPPFTATPPSSSRFYRVIQFDE